MFRPIYRSEYQQIATSRTYYLMSKFIMKFDENFFSRRFNSIDLTPSTS
ncbi:MAG: hypothetical protein ACI809_002785 [Candidatus Azotimanducaceae bacterium]